MVRILSCLVRNGDIFHNLSCSPLFQLRIRPFFIKMAANAGPTKDFGASDDRSERNCKIDAGGTNDNRIGLAQSNVRILMIIIIYCR